jgi:hypothetical protein
VSTCAAVEHDDELTEVAVHLHHTAVDAHLVRVPGQTEVGALLGRGRLFRCGNDHHEREDENEDEGSCDGLAQAGYDPGATPEVGRLAMPPESRYLAQGSH